MLLWYLSLLTTTPFLKFSTDLTSDFTFSWVIFTSQSPLLHPPPLLLLPKEFISSLFATHSATYVFPGKYLLLLGPDNTYILTAPKSISPTQTFLE